MARGGVALAARPPLTRSRRRGVLLVLVGVLLLTLLVALLIGTGTAGPFDALRSLFDADRDPTTSTILFDVRLPRVLLAAGVGGLLAGTGVLFQAILRNPLAEPYILGVSNGCAVGAILGMLVGLGSLLLPLAAFAGGMITVAIVLTVARGGYRENSEGMLLAGVMIGAIGAALIFLMLHLLGPQLRSALQWMLGDLSGAPAASGPIAVGVAILLLIPSLPLGGSLNALALGEEESLSLGVDGRRLRVVLFVAGSLVVGTAVAFCGAIGFVGLVVPHLLRRVFGPDHRLLLPASIIGGGIFLVICDTVARMLPTTLGAGAGELPIGAVTALIGAPVYIVMLRRK